jgi:hypothetical protein
MLAIDVGMLMTARNQAQNAADAGALASAVALVFDDYNDRSASGPAVQNAIAAATANDVMGGQVSISPADVTFINDPDGLPNWVRVTVFRSGGRSNPVSTMIATYFGAPTSDIVATATAEAAPANAADCVLPFATPDRWIERQTPAWDPNDTFSAYPKNPSVLPDLYVPADQSGYSGYSPQLNTGLQLTIKAGTGNNIHPSFYFPIALPGSSGAADYRWNIANCNTSVLQPFDLLTAEPGNMVGPTKQGVEDLIALDPSAYWNGTKVVSSMSPSPRIKLMPVFDPYYYDTGKKNGQNADLKAANFIGIFVEGMQGNDVKGRIVPARGLLKAGLGPAPVGAFPKAIRLVQ